MKKILSIMMAIAMLVSCFAVSTSVMADEIPAINVGDSVSVTFPKNGSDEKIAKVAKFVPTASGWYEFECDVVYTSTSSKADQIPGGVFAVDLYEDNAFATQGLCFFLDTSKLSDKDKADYAAAGVDLSNFNRLITAAYCEKGKTYYVTGYQDGADDFTANLTMKKHEHKIKSGQVEKVAVNKNGKSKDAGGVYDACECFYCSYMEYTENYYQITSTTVKNAVYTGKAVKPAVKIITATDKKLSSKYYTVTYKNNKNVGTGTAIIKFRNGYTGTVKKTFKIYPKATSVKKVTSRKKQLKVNYKKVADVTGYQVQVATNKKFTKNKKTVTVKGAKKTSAKVKKLKGGKKYYVRVRTYKVVSGKKYYSAWATKTKPVKVKK